MEYYDVARILTTHGLNGEVKVNVITDFPEERFAKGMHLAIKGETDHTLTIQKVDPLSNFGYFNLLKLLILIKLKS